MKIENIKISELKAAEYNPRTISKEAFEKLKKNIVKFGLVEPIVINADNTVIGGHQRLKAAEELGIEQVPCFRVELDKKSEKALNLALNKISGDWDFGKLSEVLKELEADKSFDIELTGFDLVSAAELDVFSGGTFPSIETPLDLDIPAHASAEKKYSITYVLVFNNEAEQAQWNDWLKKLKEIYPDKETISERIIEYIKNGD